MCIKLNVRLSPSPVSQVITLVLPGWFGREEPPLRLLLHTWINTRSGEISKCCPPWRGSVWVENQLEVLNYSRKAAWKRLSLHQTVSVHFKVWWKWPLDVKTGPVTDWWTWCLVRWPLKTGMIVILSRDFPSWAVAFYSSTRVIMNLLVVSLKNKIPAEKASLGKLVQQTSAQSQRNSTDRSGTKLWREFNYCKRLFKCIFRPVGSCPHIVNIALKYKTARILCLSRWWWGVNKASHGKDFASLEHAWLNSSRRMTSPGYYRFSSTASRIVLLFCQRSSEGVSHNEFLLISLVMSSNCMWLESRLLFSHLLP